MACFFNFKTNLVLMSQSMRPHGIHQPRQRWTNNWNHLTPLDAALAKKNGIMQILAPADYDLSSIHILSVFYRL
jgi:hypothetical protein